MGPCPAVWETDPIGFSPSLPHCLAHSCSSWCTVLGWYRHTIHTGSPPTHPIGQSMLGAPYPWDSWSQSLSKRGTWQKLITPHTDAHILYKLLPLICFFTRSRWTELLTVFILAVNYSQISFLCLAQGAGIGPVGFNVILLSSEQETFIVETQPTCNHKDTKTEVVNMNSATISCFTRHL